MDEFFDPPRPPESFVEPLPPREWDGPPRDAVPAIVPIEQVVAQSDDAGVYLACLWVYPAGFEFEVFVVAKDEWANLDPFSYDHQYEAEQTGEIPPAQLRLGFSFADGTKATNTGNRFDWEGDFDSPKAPVMSGARGHSGGGRWARSFWVWPIPPSGRFQFVCDWPALCIPLTYTDLDSAAIIDAASRAQKIFPSS